MNEETAIDDKGQPRGRLRYPAVVEMIILVFLGLVLMIGLAMIRGRVNERMQRSTEAREEIAGSWGRAQTIGGPMIIVPYWAHAVNQKGEPVKVARRAYFLPDALTVNGTISPERRRRGIFEAVLYQTELKVEGAFAHPDFSDWRVDPQDILWDEAVMTIGIPDLRGLRGNPDITFDAAPLVLTGGSAEARIWPQGLTAKVPLQPSSTSPHKFSFVLKLNGSQSLAFTPVAKQTVVNLSSKWADPGFAGAFLPESRTVRPDGFDARWSVSSLARSYPQRWIETSADQLHVESIRGSEFRVDLVTPVSQYLQTRRATEYGALFIVLTFVTFFLYELFCPVSLHPVQYFLVGGALCLFYLLLLSISEHAPFLTAYLIASTATVALICLYAIALFRRAWNVIGLFAVLTALYGYLYVLLQMEDWALLTGSIGLFVILAIIMYLTRRVDWGTVHKPAVNTA